MTTEALILQQLKLIREDLAKLKQQQYKQDKEKETWVTANILHKKFKVNYRELEQLRRMEVIKFKQLRPGVVRYLLSSAEQFFNKKAS